MEHIKNFVVGAITCTIVIGLLIVMGMFWQYTLTTIVCVLISFAMYMTGKSIREEIAKSRSTS